MSVIDDIKSDVAQIKANTALILAAFNADQVALARTPTDEGAAAILALAAQNAEIGDIKVLTGDILATTNAAVQALSPATPVVAAGSGTSPVTATS